MAEFGRYPAIAADADTGTEPSTGANAEFGR
jgi:hypothetical protein